MSEQIFISYRRTGGDVYAKLICEAIKNRGYTVFYDIDSIHGGYFDNRILEAIAGCRDVVLVLPPNSLDRCVNEGDWVRQEIAYALKQKKNIVPVILPGFVFPQNLPEDIAEIARYNGVKFVMDYFDAVIDAVLNRCTVTAGGEEEEISPAAEPAPQPEPKPMPVAEPEPEPAPDPAPQSEPTPDPEPRTEVSFGLQYVLDGNGRSYRVSGIGDCKDVHVVIPETYLGRPVTGVAANAFKGCTHIQYVTLPSSIQKIEKDAFCDCTALLKMTVPKGVMSIGDRAFSGCTSLTSVVLPNSVRYIGDEVFSGCKALKEVKLPIRVEALGKKVFGRCKALESVSLPSGITSVGKWMFFGCRALTAVYIPDGVQTIESNAFEGCYALTCIAIPRTVTSIEDYAFHACNSLMSITIPTGTLKIGSGAFFCCSKLESVTISNSVTSIGERGFSGCSALTRIQYLGTKAEWKKISLGKHCFKDVLAAKVHCIDWEAGLPFFR